MFKVKHERTADCVVAGFRWHKQGPGGRLAALGLHDEDGKLQHVGVVGLVLDGAPPRAAGQNGAPTRQRPRRAPPVTWARARPPSASRGRWSRWNCRKDLWLGAAGPNWSGWWPTTIWRAPRFRHARSSTTSADPRPVAHTPSNSEAADPFSTWPATACRRPLVRELIPYGPVIAGQSAPPFFRQGERTPIVQAPGTANLCLTSLIADLRRCDATGCLGGI